MPRVGEGHVFDEDTSSVVDFDSEGAVHKTSNGDVRNLLEPHRVGVLVIPAGPQLYPIREDVDDAVSAGALR